MTVIDPAPIERPHELGDDDDTNVWGPSSLGVVREQGAVAGLGDPGLPGHASDTEAIEDVDRSDPTARTSHVVTHVIDTIERGSDQVRGRVVRVVGNLAPTALLEENPNRTRALLKVVTSNAVVMVQQGRQGGTPQLTATPVGPQSAFPIATGDPVLEIKATAPIEGYTISAAGFVDVAVWEELEGAGGGNAPGIT